MFPCRLVAPFIRCPDLWIRLFCADNDCLTNTAVKRVRHDDFSQWPFDQLPMPRTQSLDQGHVDVNTLKLLSTILVVPLQAPKKQQRRTIVRPDPSNRGGRIHPYHEFYRCLYATPSNYPWCLLEQVSKTQGIA